MTSLYYLPPSAAVGGVRLEFHPPAPPCEHRGRGASYQANPGNPHHYRVRPDLDPAALRHVLTRRLADLQPTPVVAWGAVCMVETARTRMSDGVVYHHMRCEVLDDATTAMVHSFDVWGPSRYDGLMRRGDFLGLGPQQRVPLALIRSVSAVTLAHDVSPEGCLGVADVSAITLYPRAHGDRCNTRHSWQATPDFVSTFWHEVAHTYANALGPPKEHLYACLIVAAKLDGNDLRWQYAWRDPQEHWAVLVENYCKRLLVWTQPRRLRNFIAEFPHRAQLVELALRDGWKTATMAPLPAVARTTTTILSSLWHTLSAISVLIVGGVGHHIDWANMGETAFVLGGAASICMLNAYAQLILGSCEATPTATPVARPVPSAESQPARRRRNAA